MEFKETFISGNLKSPERYSLPYMEVGTMVGTIVCLDSILGNIVLLLWPMTSMAMT